MTSPTALLWNTHIWGRELEQEFEKFLKMDYPGSPEVWLVLDSKIPDIQTIVRKYERCYTVDERKIFQHLPYPCLEHSGLLYHPHFILLDFYLSHPEYEWYWFVEYDVRYNGEWGSLLRSFESFDHDLITSHIRHFSEEPWWPWWDTLYHPSKKIEKNQYLRSFNPIYRMSNRSLKFIHEAQKEGWQGLYEVSFPTLLHIGGYRIMDFGGDGDFTPPGLTNKTYTSHGLKNGLLNPFCTMRWRPSSNHAGLRRNKLYHAIKPLPMVESVKERWEYLETWTRNFLHYNVFMRAR